MLASYWSTPALAATIAAWCALSVGGIGLLKAYAVRHRGDD